SLRIPRPGRGVRRFFSAAPLSAVNRRLRTHSPLGFFSVFYFRLSTVDCKLDSPFRLFHTFPQSHQTISIPPTPSSLSTSANLLQIRASPFEYRLSNSENY